MGAKHSCCAYSSPRTENRSKKDKNRGRESSRENDRYEPSQINNISHKVSESIGNLQHIRWILTGNGTLYWVKIFFSEREPDDWEDDPSLHPTHTTMFMEKSKQAIINGMSRKKSMKDLALAGSQSIGDFTTLKKASSCSTIYIDDSTVSQPNLKNTIKCVSLAIYYHIKNRNSDTILDIFDEKKQPLTVRNPIIKKIFIKFISFYSVSAGSCPCRLW